jgi:hypothetical protein
VGRKAAANCFLVRHSMWRVWDCCCSVVVAFSSDFFPPWGFVCGRELPPSVLWHGGVRHAHVSVVDGGVRAPWKFKMGRLWFACEGGRS